MKQTSFQSIPEIVIQDQKQRKQINLVSAIGKQTTGFVNRKPSLGS